MTDQDERARRGMYVRRLATGLSMNGPVAADLPGWEKPRPVGNTAGSHVPDIEARLGLMHCLIAVETDPSLERAGSEDRWRVFDSWARMPGRMFLLAVPAPRERDVRDRLARLGIAHAEVITI